MSNIKTNITIRPAQFDDVQMLQKLIAASVHGLQAGDYSPSQRDAALGTIFGVDSNLIKDQTYFVVEADNEIIGCGGWSFRKAMFGADTLTQKEPENIDPATDAARIRAFFIAPEFARMGIGKMILQYCEKQAKLAGFKSAELGSTLTGIEFYRKFGYQEVKNIEADLPNGEKLGLQLMRKTLD